jgi:ribosomal protein uL23
MADKEKEKNKEKKGSATMKLLKYPYLTEKSMTLVERANTRVFVVDMAADKQHVKDEFEAVFGVKVAKVNVLVTPDGKKKAFVKLKPEFKAGDVATKLGVV